MAYALNELEKARGSSFSPWAVETEADLCPLLSESESLEEAVSIEDMIELEKERLLLNCRGEAISWTENI